ncbi:MAG: hypothetical protein AB1593_00760 [Pseudomonadota bacterium]
MNSLLGFVLVILAVWAGVLAAFARPIAARWREPVLKCPVLAIESDDWGAGPLAQAEVLAQLKDMLAGLRDVAGRPALMTLGVVMEVPDGPRIAAGGCVRYHGSGLAGQSFEAVRIAMHEGIAAGVFVPQLHGQSHYWPGAVLQAAQSDATVRDWLTGAAPACSEALPSHLQSRWVDASRLPSRTLDAASIRHAVMTEAAGWRALFDSAPEVAVATTFVWNDMVEAAWREAGVAAVITPGRRATCRDATGRPGCEDRAMLTGDESPSGLMYLVRDVYFEPARGHLPTRLVEGLAMRTRQGRACLVETHRFNFLEQPEASLAALRMALAAAHASHPDLRYLAPRELAQAIRVRDPAWIEHRLSRRMRALRARLAEIPRFARTARWSGLGWVLA